MKRIFLLFVLIILCIHSFSQCDSAFFRQAATSIYDASLITDKIIVGVGYNGRIIKSTDGGNSWRNIPNNYGNSTLKTVQFTNDSVGYVTGAGGIMKTEDQGESWYPLQFPIDPYFGTTYYDMHFFNEDTGIFVGSYGHILSTTDGGRSFKDTTIGDDPFFSIDFVNDSTGLIVGRGIYKTTNGGKTWRAINIDNLAIDPTNASLRKIRYVRGSFAAVAGDNNTFATSSDGGGTWTPGTPNYNVSSINDFIFFDTSNGIAAGNGSLLLHTSDGGKTFTFNPNDPQEGNLFSFNTDPLKKRVMAVGGSGFNSLSNERYIISSLDKGNSWIVQSNNPEMQYSYTQFLNDSTGFIASANDYFYKTRDYGESWKGLGHALTNLGNAPRLFCFSDSLHGYAVTEMVSYTNDGGRNWVERSSLGGTYGDAPEYMVFLDSLHGAASFREMMYYTVDGAVSWQLSQLPPLPPYNYVTGMVRTRSGKLFTSGDNGNAMQSADSGRTWTLVKLHNDNLASIYFYNDSIGFAGTTDSVIFKTVNGGVSWDSISTHIHNIPFRSFAFSDSLNGFMLGNIGPSYLSGFYQTRDGGVTWKNVYGNNQHTYNLTGNHTIYATGNDGTIIKADHLVKPSIPGYINGPSQLCNGISAIYTVAPGNNISYTWHTTPLVTETGSTAADTIIWKGAGEYMVTVAAQNTCGVGAERKQTVNVIDFKPVITVTDTGLSVTRGLNYKWYLNDTLIKSGSADSDEVLIPAMAGIYKAEVESVLGCTGISDTVVYSLPLPFKLLSFSGALSSDKMVDLQWTVANEKSNLYEVIQRGADSTHFASFDSIPARNNYNAGDSYTYTDHKAVSGINLYRLKFTGRSRTISYSPIIAVRGSTDAEPLLYPNPAKDVVTVYKGSEDIDAVSIYNNQGFLVATQRFSSGQASVTIDISSLQNGLYYVKIKTARNLYSQQLVILR